MHTITQHTYKKLCKNGKNVHIIASKDRKSFTNKIEFTQIFKIKRGETQEDYMS